jgi:hypothetical protein
MKNERFAHVTPNPGAYLMDPDDRFAPLPAEGKRVRMSPYWDHIEIDGTAATFAHEGAAVAPTPKPSREVKS